MEEPSMEIIVVNSKTIKDKIYIVRGQQVMLATDLAEIYGYATKDFNRQVRNNIAKFDSDFMFELTKKEVDDLRCKNPTANISTKSRYLPNVFTEQGIYMLMTVLKGDLATQQSKALIRTFKAMKNYIIENQDLIGAKEILQISVQTNRNTEDIAEIKEQMATKEELQKVMDNFIDPDTYKHFLIMDGQKIEADTAYSKIYKSAKKSIYVVDNYIGLKTLELLRAAKTGVKIVVFSDNVKNKAMLTSSVLADFKSDYPEVDIIFQTTCGKYHDRYIAIDYGTRHEAIYHCGASSKDAGGKITTISRIDDAGNYHPMFDELIHNPNLEIL